MDNTPQYFAGTFEGPEALAYRDFCQDGTQRLNWRVKVDSPNSGRLWLTREGMEDALIYAQRFDASMPPESIALALVDGAIMRAPSRLLHGTI